MLSKLRLRGKACSGAFRCFCDGGIAHARCLAFSHRSRDTCPYSGPGRLCYSTRPASRFDRSVSEDDEMQYTATFAAKTHGLPCTEVASQRRANSRPLEAHDQSTPASGITHLPSEHNVDTSPTKMSSEAKVLDPHASLSGQTTVARWKALSVPQVETAVEAQQRTPIPLELLPPRATRAPQVSLLSRPRTDSFMSDNGSPQASSCAIPAASTPATAIPSTSGYSHVFRSSFINPFNGRLVHAESPSAKLLFKVGFYRSLVNPLHLEWSPTEYMAALQKVMTARQRTIENRKAKQLRQERKEQRLARAARQAQWKSKNKRKTHRKVTPAAPAPRSTEIRSCEDAASTAANSTSSTETVKQLPLEPLTPAEAIAQARAKLLHPFSRYGPGHWKANVAQIMERQDVFTFMNSEVKRLYADLCTAYVPPKLDTPIDASVANMELTRDQKHVMQLALRGFSLFVGGSAGTGKTVLLKSIFRELSLLGLHVAVTATTGVAAVQLGGCTFHHAFNAPVEATSQRWDANALRAVDVVIVDEVSLLDANMFDAFDMEARLARMHHVPFGGLQVIVCGDFLQLSRDDTMPAYESAAFKHLVPVRLVTPMRHCANDPLLKLLEELRRGEFNSAQFEALDRTIPPSTTHITYIFPRRREAQQLNDAKLSELESREMTFTPQRGPLQLCGTFTKSALIEMTRDANGMQKSLPRREQLLDMIHSEAQHLSSAQGRLYRIADHELVIMPVRAESTTATRFVVRVRCREQGERVAGEPRVTDAPTGASSSSSSNATEMRVNGGGTIPTTPTAVNSAVASIVKPASAVRHLQVNANRRHRCTAPFTESEWEKIVSAVATRLGGRLVSLLCPEPASLVPLSVSMMLADMTSPDIAHSLSPLRLKLGCRVMVNRNLSRTVSNGSVGIVEAFAPLDATLFPRNTDRARRNTFNRITQSKLFEELPIVRLLSGEVVQVPPVSLLIGGTADSYYYGHEVFTIPLQLGYAFTVHKVQGLTLQGTVVLDCEKFFDCPHLIYVACSRVRELDQLVVRHVEPRMIIVRRSALEFSERLQEACTVNTHSLPPTCVRASWTARSTQRMLALSD